MYMSFILLTMSLNVSKVNSGVLLVVVVVVGVGTRSALLLLWWIHWIESGDKACAVVTEMTSNTDRMTRSIRRLAISISKLWLPGGSYKISNVADAFVPFVCHLLLG